MSEPAPHPDAPPRADTGRCRVCGAAFRRPAEHEPFCSERCRLVDLGRWFDGRYKVSRDATAADFEDHASQ